MRMALMDVRGNMMIRSSPCGWFRPRCCREVDLLMVLVPLRLDDLEEGAEGLPPMVTTADFRCSVTIVYYHYCSAMIDHCRFLAIVNTVGSHNPSELRN